MSPKKQLKPNVAALSVVLDDLCMRFLVNLPAEEYESFERLFFAIESAHWFYDDFYREKDPSLPRLPLKAFAAKLFAHTALLRHHREDVDRLTSQFQSYKQEVPTCGAALINPALDKVLLVRAWGSNARWGFPKGKLSKDETERDAAVREVLEETGFDAGPLVDDSTFYVDSMSSGRHCRIFVVAGVPEDTVFETRTRKEISDIKWVPISALPDAPKAAKVQHKVTLCSPGPVRTQEVQKIFFSQYGVPPYTKRLRSWIKRRKKQIRTQSAEVPASLSVVQLEEMPLRETCEKALDPCAMPTCAEIEQSMCPSPETALLSNALSVEELEATLVSPNQQQQEKQKGNRGKSKANGTVGKEGNRKSKKGMDRDEDKRNRTTFGAAGGTRMNSSERDTLFHQYVIETDRIAAEKGLRDDLWPVPYLTTKDLTEEQRRAAEEARAKRQNNPLDPPVAGSPRQTRTGWHTSTMQRPIKGTKEEPFFFDRAAIMACLKS